MFTQTRGSGFKFVTATMLAGVMAFGGLLATVSTAFAANVPVITVLGSDPVTISVGSTYTDAGATAVDGFRAPINDSITTTGLPIDTSVAGTYTVTYTVNITDGDDPVSASKTRTVNVVAPYVTTEAATGITSTDATLNGTNGGSAANQESFWVSTATFDTSSPNIPANVYSTPVIPGVAGGASFSKPLSIISTNGIITGGASGNLAITPNTMYYYAAWSDVGGTWHPGEIKTFTTLAADTTAPSVPVHVSPADNSTLTQAAMIAMDWNDSTDTDSMPVTYIYQSATDPATNPDGSFTTPAYTSGVLTDSTIPTPSTPEGVYYWHVKAIDSLGNPSAWSSMWKVTVSNAAPVGPLCDASSFDTFTLGSVNGQDGWSATGPYDQAIVNNTYGFSTFGCKTLRVSDATASGSFGDWIFTKSLANEAGETVAVSNDMSSGTRQSTFTAEFDIASVLSTLQAGMHVSVSPDRGDGARMSYLRFEDQTDGIHVFFDDYSSGIFNESDIATIDRNPHTIKFVMKFVDGASNDVVEIYIDGVLETTGTSWEDYFRFDPEQAGSGNVVPTVDSLIIQARGTSHAGNLNNGFLFDNFNLSSSTDPVTPVVTTPATTFVGSHTGPRQGSVLGASTDSTGQVLGAEKFFFTLFLKMGPPYHMSTWGNEVMELQKFLNTAGYDSGVVDGKFGPITKAALIKFQLANGLKGDGIVGPLTREVLNK